MAKNTGRLAGLAALAGAAYLMNKDKDNKPTPKGKEDTGAGYKSTETGRMSDEDKAEMKRETQRGPIGSIPSKPKSASVTKPSVIASDIPAVDARDAEAGMSRGTRSATPESTSTTSSSEEGMKNYTTRAGSLAGAGRGSVNPPSVTPQQPARDVEAGMSRGTRPPVVGAGRGTVNPKSVTPQQPARDLEAGMSRGRREMPPSPGQAKVDAIRKLQAAAGVPSSRAGRPGYDEAGRPTMAGRTGYDEAGNPMKKGGAVKKMASGGMTASKRADGIASKGKTRCKMY